MCGCGTIVGKLESDDAAVMCLMCRHRCGEECRAERTVGGGAADGKAELVEVRIMQRSCPRGHHGIARTGETRVRWLGLSWSGVPRPIRWLLRDVDVRRAVGLNDEPVAPRHACEWTAGTAKRSGCGCIARLKAAWTGAAGSAWMRRAACAAVVAIAAALAMCGR